VLIYSERKVLLAAGGWFVLREKYRWLVADKLSEQAAVAWGVVDPPVEGGVLHCVPIPTGYAKVIPGWEDLELEIEGGDGQKVLDQAVHSWILWPKKYIKFTCPSSGLGSSSSTRARATGQERHLLH
jgi:hypothetical protein